MDLSDLNHLAFRAPPVCTAYWDEDAWRCYILAHGAPINKEPATMELCGETWHKTDKINDKGEAVYRREGT